MDPEQKPRRRGRGRPVSVGVRYVHVLLPPERAAEAERKLVAALRSLLPDAPC